MEDGPYRNTRASAGSLNRSSEKDGHYGNQNTSNSQETEVFSEYGTPKPNEIYKTRNRTPSGHYITNSVGDIRSFFDKTETSSPLTFKNKVVKDLLNPSATNSPAKDSQTKDATLNRNQPSGKGKQRKQISAIQTQLSFSAIKTTAAGVNATDMAQSELSLKQTQQQQIYSPRQVLNPSQLSNKDVKRSSKTATNKEGDRQFSRDSVNSVNIPQTSLTPTQKKMDKKPKSAISLAEEFLAASETTEPKVMDLRIVLEMFKEIKKDIKENSTKMDNVTDSQQQNVDDLTNLQKEVEFYKKKSDVMSGVIQKMSKSMSSMEVKINRLERNTAPPAVVVSGQRVSDKKQDAKLQLEDFFKQTIGVTVDAIDHYTVGTGENQAIVVNVEDFEQKGEILQNKSKLKNITSSSGSKFYINDHVPAEVNERKTRERQIFYANKRNTASTVEMSFFKGGLRIQNQRYRTKVTVPDPSNFLSMTSEEFEQIMSVKLHQGKQVSDEKGGNVLAAFTAPTATLNDVNKAYAKMKLQFPQATHIVGSFSVPGQETYYCQDYCDDGDYGAGRRILDLMKKNNITSRAIFVVRFTDGTKLGGKRFPSYLDAAIDAINTSPENYLTKTSQRINKKQLSPSKPRSTSVLPRSGRGGGGHNTSTRTYQPLSTNRIRKNEWFKKNSEQENKGENFEFQNPWNAMDTTGIKEYDTGAWSNPQPDNETEDWAFADSNSNSEELHT